jgi:hypothetical protein
MNLVTRARQSDRALTYVQIAFGAACVAVAVPLIFELGPAATVTNGTSVRVLGAALLALAVGAFSSAEHARRHWVTLRVEIVFNALTAGFLLYRILVDHLVHDRAWIVLPPVAVGLVLLLVLYPYGSSE